MDIQWEFDAFRSGEFYFAEKYFSDETLERTHIPISLLGPGLLTVMLAFVRSETSISKQMRFELFHFQIDQSTSH